MLKLLTRDSEAPLEHRDVAVRPRTFDATANTIEVVAVTATPVRRRDARGEYVEVLDVAGADLDALRGASVLDGHRQSGVRDVIGTVEEAWVEGEQIIARLRLSEREDLAAIRTDIRSGIIRNVSAGYQVERWEESRDADGNRVRTAVKWTPREISFVAIAADPNARTRHDSRASINREIRQLAARAGVSRDVADNLIDRDATVEEARNAMLDDLITRGRAPIRAGIGTDYTAPEMQNRAIEDAFYCRLSGATPNGRTRELMGSAIDLMQHFLRATGVVLQNRDPAEIMRRSLHTTSDFPVLMANAMNKRLGELFKVAESGASAIAATGTAKDFRPISEARLTSFPELEKVNEAGEIKWGTLTEGGETLALASFAKAIGISFQLLINDDMAAIDRSIRDTAFAAAVLKAKLIVAALSASLADSNPLFHSTHGNLATSAGVPDETRLSAGRLAMMKQTAPGSTEPLGISPAILLVPAELQTTAEKLLAAITPATTSEVNVFAGRLRIAVEPRLPNGTQWFLFSDPSVYPTIRFLTLAGFEQPRFETSNEFSRIGTAYRVHWHVGAGPIEHRGAFKNAG